MHAGAHRAFRAWRTAGNGLEKDAAGKAQVMLTYHLAEACHIPEAVAHRIIRNCFEWQGVDTLTKNPIDPLLTMPPRRYLSASRKDGVRSSDSIQDTASTKPQVGMPRRAVFAVQEITSQHPQESDHLPGRIIPTSCLLLSHQEDLLVPARNRMFPGAHDRSI